MGGDGGLEKLKERIRFLDEAGASIVEIGIRFQIQSQMVQRFKEQGNER